MNYKVLENRVFSRRVLLERISLSLMGAAATPLMLLGCGDGSQLEPSIADGRIVGTELNGATVALTSITRTEDPTEPVRGRVVLNEKVLSLEVNVSNDIQQAFRFVSTSDNQSVYQSVFYDSAGQPYSIETTVTELVDGFLVKVANEADSASLMIPRSLVSAATPEKPTSSNRDHPAASVVLWVVIVVAASWLVAQLIDLAKMALCLAEGGTIYSSSVGVVNNADGQQWGVTSICQKPTGGNSPR